MLQTDEVAPKRPIRRYSTQWKCFVVKQSFESGVSVARVAREHNIRANQVWAWRKLYTQGLLVESSQPGDILPVVVNEAVTHADAQACVQTVPSTPCGTIHIMHGKTSVRLEGVPDAATMHIVLDRILR